MVCKIDFVGSNKCVILKIHSIEGVENLNQTDYKFGKSGHL